uniref:Uncharacterized protein n=1 Tax=Kalanchoe fedtschenkoi TaxID=63787 RepID=A0A7N0U7F0_KALFE
MDSVKIPRKRGRKRKRKDGDGEDGRDGLEQRGAARPVALVGRYLKKQFEGRNYIGKIVSYDSGLYRVEYEDGDCEDLDSGEARPFLIGDDAFTKTLVNRRRKLDDLISKKAHADEGKLEQATALAGEMYFGIGNGTVNFEEHQGNRADSDMDSASESCKSQDSAVGVEAESVFVPPLELPPSSGTIGVPDGYISHLFSVYSFLRSFSIRLFLSPFGLDDFVGALNCPAQNTLLDAIHVALLRALRRHLENMSADGSELASKCLRCVEWDLLDSLTWPVYIIQYLMVMGYTNGRDWKGFYRNVLEREYYSLSVGMKLVILQMLCDDILNSAEIRAEVDMREEEEGEDSEITTDVKSESIPQRVHPRFSKPSACKDQEAMKIIADNHEIRSRSIVSPANFRGTQFVADSGSVDQDSNSDECRMCGMDGTLLCCDGCPSAYHSRCIGVNKLLIPDGAWFCPECTVDKIGPVISNLTSLQSAEIFGIDSDGRVFLGTCDHLLVLKAFIEKEPCHRYYNKFDIKRVAQTLYSKLSDPMYFGICKGILKYWQIPEDTFVLGEKVETCEIVPNQEGEFSGAAQRSLAVKSSIDVAHRASDNRSVDVLEGNSLSILAANPFQVRTLTHDRKACSYTGSNFNRNAYINHYSHGDFAASAAANLAVLSSEENRGLEVHALETIKKAMSANVLLHVKAFSSAATRFFWPNSERKYVEVPRERCGWCLSCRGAISSKKACMLNAACLNAHRGAMKFLTALRVSKNDDACLASIATYILYMEDSLSALMVGPFTSASYRRQWRKKVEHASTCCALKSYLLELERNVRDVALTSDWVKHVGDSFIESLAVQNSSVTPASVPKRGRPKKKLAGSSEVAECQDKDVINWWRGGKLSKLIFQKGMLPSRILKRAAREGGKNKIPGLYYAAEDSGIPRRSRQFIWRAAVEMCKNTSQLAIQVRTLDHHLRWSDLNRPELSSHESKGSDTEASVFRNALICDKRIVGTKISYGVVFGNQKHLPLRIMKSVTDLEQDQNSRDKHWFPEMRIPLYLIKEFEAGIVEASSQSADRASQTLSNLQKKQLKDSRRDIFLYLARKRDNESKCSCTACPLEVLLRDAVKCSDCRGYCHADCTLSVNTPATLGAGLAITCKQCYFMKPLTQGETSNSPTSPLLPFQGQGQGRSAMKSIKGSKLISVDQPLSAAGNDKSHHAKRPSASHSTLTKKKKNKILSWGLIWKKKKTDNNCDFLRTNFLLRGTVCFESAKPACTLCQKPYNPDLTYIRCETCRKWYHSDAVELDESKISELMGFKCCKCRRIRSPCCPYLDPDKRKPEANGLCLVDSNPDISGFDSLGAFEALVDEESSSPLYINTDEIFSQSDDPLLFSLSKVEQVVEPRSENDPGWDISESGPKKLPVRRQVKNENGSNDSEVANQPFLDDTMMNGDISNDAEAQDGLMFDLDSFNCEDMEFEPHTYFSMTELLEESGEMDIGHTPVSDYGLCSTSSMSNVGTGIHESDNNCGQQEPEPQENESFNIRQCDSCKCTVPPPDLSCDLCGLSIHRSCSPWFETTSVADGWRCGSCREWE